LLIFKWEYAMNPFYICIGKVFLEISGQILEKLNTKILNRRRFITAEINFLLDLKIYNSILIVVN